MHNTDSRVGGEPPPLFSSAADGRVLLDFESLDYVISQVGATAALVLSELGATSYVRHGSHLSRTSERDLARRLGPWGRGFSRSPVAQALDVLLASGWISRSARGEFTLWDRLFDSSASVASHPESRAQYASVPVRTEDGPPYGTSLARKPGQVPAKESAVGAKLALVPSQEAEPASHDDVSFLKKRTSSSDASSQEEASLVVQAAHRLGVRGALLTRVRHEPLRALAWLAYLEQQDDVSSIPRYLNTVMMRSEAEFPPEFDAACTWRIDASGNVPVLVNEHNERYAGQAVQAPVATIACIDQALQTLNDGVYLQDHPQYVSLVENARAALAAEGHSGVRLQYVAHYRALQAWGLLEDYAEPFQDPSGQRARHA